MKILITILALAGFSSAFADTGEDSPCVQYQLNDALGTAKEAFESVTLIDEPAVVAIKQGYYSFTFKTEIKTIPRFLHPSIGQKMNVEVEISNRSNIQDEKCSATHSMTIAK